MPLSRRGRSPLDLLGGPGRGADARDPRGLRRVFRPLESPHRSPLHDEEHTGGVARAAGSNKKQIKVYARTYCKLHFYFAVDEYSMIVALVSRSSFLCWLVLCCVQYTRAARPREMKHILCYYYSMVGRVGGSTGLNTSEVDVHATVGW